MHSNRIITTREAPNCWISEIQFQAMRNHFIFFKTSTMCLLSIQAVTELLKEEMMQHSGKHGPNS